jgi:3-oxoadipate enol-lactonase
MTTDATASRLLASDGAPLIFKVHPGPAHAPVVALVHSLALDHRFWEPVSRRLARDATVVAVDVRGHGGSALGTSPFTSDRVARDLLEVLDHLEVPSAIVGGASMGGCVALQFAGSHPGRTSGLALIDTTAWYGPTAAQDWEGRAMKAAAQGMASLVDFQKTRWFSDDFRARNPDVVDECIRIFLENDLQAYVATCRMLGGFDGRGLLGSIRVPCRVLVGEEDYAAPVAMSQALHEAILGSRLEVIQGARHLTPLEVPDLVAAALLELCAEVKR